MLAIVFPGQGAQQVGMSADFAAQFAESRAVLETADEAFGGPLSRWIHEGPADVLRRTEVTQPAVLVASIAIYRALESRLPRRPDFFAGHSLGEYSALVAAGSLTLEDAVRLVRTRGALMQQAVPEGHGSMVAVLGLPAETVESICADRSGVYPANFNAPGQTVVAGEHDAVYSAVDEFRKAGAKRVMTLEVSAPFHCPLMLPAREKLAPALEEIPFREALVPVVSNVTARPFQSAAEARTLLREQVCSPVRWVECVRTLVESGVRVQLEVGPGSVLSAFAARIDRGLARANVSTVEEIEPALGTVAEALQ